ncbi:hypothetical protein TIFTF001_050162, partial [Ficus carica]
MSKWTRFLSVPILAVFLLVGFVYYVTVFVFIEDWVGIRSSSGSLNALVFTFLASLCVFSFFVCVLTDPGHVPASYLPDVEETGISDEETKKNNVQSKLCDKCSTYRPPRAHHCRVCRRCVLRMDHHCMWVNNCIGYWNYKAFFVLVFYATISSIYSTVMVITCAFQKDWEFSGYIPLKIEPTHLLRSQDSRSLLADWLNIPQFLSFCYIFMMHVTFGVMMVVLSLTLGTLFAWHIYLIIHNMTTIEHYEGIRAAWLARKSGQNYRHPFNISAYRNITLVLGPNMLKWFSPTSHKTGRATHGNDATQPWPSLRKTSAVMLVVMVRNQVDLYFFFTNLESSLCLGHRFEITELSVNRRSVMVIENDRPRTSNLSSSSSSPVTLPRFCCCKFGVCYFPLRLDLSIP